MSEHKYNDAYSKGFEAGKKQAFTGYCMQCYDELSPYEQAKLMVEWGADILEVLDKIRVELHATAEMHEDGDYYLREEWIDEIIDKYKESEEL